MYDITLIKLLMLFMLGTQAVAIAIPKDPKIIKALHVEGSKRFDIHDLNRKVSFKPVVHEEEAYTLSLPEGYRKRSAFKKLFPFLNPLKDGDEAGQVEEIESPYVSLPDVWERDDNAPTARRRSKPS